MASDAPPLKTSDTPKRCVECKSSIEPGAGLCPVCKTYQEWWRRNIQYVGTVIGVAAAIVGVFVYVASKLPDVWRYWWPQDKIEVVNFYSNLGVTLANSGNRDLYVNRILIALQEVPAGLPGVGAVSRSSDISVAVPIGSITTVKFPNTKKLRFVDYTTEDAWLKLARQATSTSEDSCFVFVYFSANDPLLEQFQTTYREKAHTVAATATVYYYSPQGNEWKTQNFPARAAVASVTSDKCGSLR
jgi:hypothetical protein